MTDLDKLQADVASWAKPSLALLRGTLLGAADFTSYYTIETQRFALRDGKPDWSSPIPRDRWRSLPMGEQFDAVLYLGPRAVMTVSYPSPSFCSDREYLSMRAKRMELAGFSRADFDRLIKTRYCTAQPPK